MSHKIAQHVHVFSVSQDNAADTTRKRFNHNDITAKRREHRDLLFINLLISYATRVDSDTDSHTPTHRSRPRTR